MNYTFFNSELNPLRKKRQTALEARNSYLRRLYKTNVIEWDKKLKQQNFVCAGCKQKCSFQTDHDHKTGRFRGLLCRNCNLGLGMLKDDIKTLRNLVTYLNNTVKES